MTPTIDIRALKADIQKRCKDFIDLRGRCKDNNKKIIIGTLSPHSIVLRPEIVLPETVTKCDCIILTFIENPARIFLVVLDLKSKSPDISKAVKQINACFEFFKTTILPSHEDYDISFFPVMISSGISSIGIQTLLHDTDAIIKFHGKPKRIERKYDRIELSEIIKYNPS